MTEWNVGLGVGVGVRCGCAGCVHVCKSVKWATKQGKETKVPFTQKAIREMFFFVSRPHACGGRKNA